MLADLLKATPHYLIPKKFMTTIAGRLARVQSPSVKNYLIKNFISKFNVDMKEALEENPENYANFNDFFIRHLKSNSRIIANSPVVSPVDGFVSEIGEISSGQLLQAKGRYYTVEDLLACNSNKANQFINGIFATLYLSPRDYHRVHMPIDGILQEMIYVPGKLFSVQPLLTKTRANLFARNERIVAFFDTELGSMAIVMVGAVIVGGMSTSWHGEIQRNARQERFLYPSAKKECVDFKKGDEIGYFKLGSTVIVIFGNDSKVKWRENIKAGDRILLGQSFGDIMYSM